MSKPRKPGRPAKGHKGRQRKLLCSSCGFIAYASAGAVTSAGLPTCGCGAPMTVANLRDIEAIDPEGFERMVGSLSLKAGNAAMHELGYTDSIIRRSPGRRIAQPQCATAGCSKFRKLGATHCVACEELASVPF
jgi:hypothetical protein